MSLCQGLTRIQSHNLYLSALESKNVPQIRRLCCEDLFFLLVRACRRRDADRDWIYDRCREVENEPDGCVDIWAREFYKSSVISFAKTIQDLLTNPELTVGIFSHTRPIAKSFLGQIKREFELNAFLKQMFPDILYQDPHKESPKWSLDEGIILKRKGNPKEPSVSAWGLVDGMPTSAHYDILVYDDVVTKESVSTPEMIQKTTEAFGLSLNLGKEGGRRRIIGTRYHVADTYASIINRGTAKPRIYPATDDGTFGGNPILMSKEVFARKVEDMGSYVASSQLLCNPLADNLMGFKDSWLDYYHSELTGKMNYYILVDPASAKKKTNDYTVMAVLGLAEDQNYYLVDAVRDRMNLTERTDKLFHFVRKWKPLATGYEKYGMQSDIEHIKYVQDRENYRFYIVELGGSMPKNDRIRRLVPLFENHRFYLPDFLKFIASDGKIRDFVQEFVDYEFSTFPLGSHDDMLDCISRIVDPELMATFPLKIEKGIERPYDPLSLRVADYNKAII